MRVLNITKVLEEDFEVIGYDANEENVAYDGAPESSFGLKLDLLKWEKLMELISVILNFLPELCIGW